MAKIAPVHANIAGMTRTVVQQQRTEFILVPAEALRRCRVLYVMLASALPAIKVEVMRAPHHVMNQIDEARQVLTARRLDAPQTDEP